MKFVSIDLETTGLNERTCQILEFGAAFEDEVSHISQLPTFRRIILRRQIKGEPYALWLNADLIKQIADYNPSDIANENVFCDERILLGEFMGWVRSLGLDPMNVIAAGKNFAKFDLQFIKRLPNYGKLVKFHHRIVDPTGYYTLPTDIEPPNTQTCLKRAGLPEFVAHKAVDDALDVIRLQRHGQERLWEKL
jgi:oligoribonuclease